MGPLTLHFGSNLELRVESMKFVLSCHCFRGPIFRHRTSLSVFCGAYNRETYSLKTVFFWRKWLTNIFLCQDLLHVIYYYYYYYEIILLRLILLLQSLSYITITINITLSSITIAITINITFTITFRHHIQQHKRLYCYYIFSIYIL